MSWVLVGAVAIVAFLLAGVRVIGFQPYVVLSGSMEPAYHVGSMIYVRDTNPASIEVGDSISFKLGAGDTIATHRVIEVDRENECFYTKGDANNTPDAVPVPYSNVIGKVMFNVPKLGFFSDWVTTPPGSYMAIAAGGVLLLLILLPDLIWPDKKEKKTETNSENN